GAAADAAALAALRRALALRLPDPLVPQLFVSVSALPLGENGKVDRQALHEIGERAIGERPALAAAPVPPRTPVEQVLAGLWAEVLGLEASGVGVFDSFFDLGGHSLLATQLVSRARGSFQVDLELRTLFDTPNIAGLAAAIESLEASPGRSEKIARVLLRLQAMSPEAREKLRQAAGQSATAPSGENAAAPSAEGR
ncbi:MAG TPA: phosphopantetheine-binding protein, partial [Thermoanaerobaculia bacterium]